MQFLFMILMSVLVGASALPHFMQAPNRPSFSLRKNTSFSIVAIPKFFKRVATLERSKASLPPPVSPLNEEKARNVASVDDGRPEEEVSASDAAEVIPLPKRGEVSLGQILMTSCVCQEGQMLTCILSVKGFCSHTDEPVLVTDRDQDGFENVHGLNCKPNFSYSADVRLRGNGVKSIFLDHVGARIERVYNFSNQCGILEKREEEEDVEVIRRGHFQRPEETTPSE